MASVSSEHRPSICEGEFEQRDFLLALSSSNARELAWAMAAQSSGTSQARSLIPDEIWVFMIGFPLSPLESAMESVGDRPSGAVYLGGMHAMEWFSRKTSIAGNQISNWVLVLAALVVIWVIYSFAIR